jgi:teichuronic acid biosynthesis glycosyltransferase TuaG
MKQNDIIISVVLCTYNAEKFIQQTVESLLNQSFQNFELLILDNNSQDNTCQLLQNVKLQDNRIHIF